MMSDAVFTARGVPWGVHAYPVADWRQHRAEASSPITHHVAARAADLLVGAFLELPAVLLWVLAAA